MLTMRKVLKGWLDELNVEELGEQDRNTIKSFWDEQEQ